jgi:signal transduction histidine kinase
MQPNPTSHMRIRARILDEFARLENLGPPAAGLPALAVLFGLSFELDSFRDLKTLCVLVPDLCLGTPASLYMRAPSGELRLRRTTSATALKTFALPDPPCPDNPGITRMDGHTMVALCEAGEESSLIGVLCLHRQTPPGEDAFWLEFGHMAAQLMTLKRASLASRKRLTFIGNLFHDIGHNVIVPNIRFKLLFLQMERQLARLVQRIDELAPPRSGAPDREARLELPDLARRLLANQRSISKRFQQSSLFLESLLRKSHIDKGAYDLQLKTCEFKSQIFEPQLERFLDMFLEQGIRIEIDPDVRIDEDITFLADLGLLSQVFANLLANAVKNTRPMPLPGGGEGKLLRYGWSVVPDALGPGRPGVRLFVATTGFEIPPEEQARLFDEGFRSGTNEAGEGSGHGLSFVKQIVELHSGCVGYEYAAPMNIFHILLPKSRNAAGEPEAESCPSPY